MPPPGPATRAVATPARPTGDRDEGGHAATRWASGTDPRRPSGRRSPGPSPLSPSRPGPWRAWRSAWPWAWRSVWRWAWASTSGSTTGFGVGFGVGFGGRLRGRCGRRLRRGLGGRLWRRDRGRRGRRRDRDRAARHLACLDRCRLGARLHAERHAPGPDRERRAAHRPRVDRARRQAARLEIQGPHEPGREVDTDPVRCLSEIVLVLDREREGRPGRARAGRHRRLRQVPVVRAGDGHDRGREPGHGRDDERRDRECAHEPVAEAMSDTQTADLNSLCPRP